MPKCIEIIVYSVKPEKVDEFKSIKDTLIKEAYLLNGLISSTTSKSIESDHIFLDKMKWESPSYAQSGFENFKKLPTTGKFMALLDGPPVYSGRFEEMF